MSSHSPSLPEKAQEKLPGHDKKERLSSALRSNLRRRKRQDASAKKPQS